MNVCTFVWIWMHLVVIVFVIEVLVLEILNFCHGKLNCFSLVSV